MKPWDLYTWEFPDVEAHPAVILWTEARLANKPKVNVLLDGRDGSPSRPGLFLARAVASARRPYLFQARRH